MRQSNSMRGAAIEIGRLTVALHGVSATMAQAAVAGLDTALRQRLGAIHGSRSADIPTLRIDALDLPPDADASALRALIADRLCVAIEQEGLQTRPEGV